MHQIFTLHARWRGLTRQTVLMSISVHRNLYNEKPFHTYAYVIFSELQKNILG